MVAGGRVGVDSGGGFVPNDTLLDSDGTRILLLTGPNMSGKSTYLRQVALIALLDADAEQIGQPRADGHLVGRELRPFGKDDAVTLETREER